MKQTPQDILSRFVRLLHKNKVSVDQQAEDKKWLRFYLNFCNKYYFPPTYECIEKNYLVPGIRNHSIQVKKIPLSALNAP